MREFPGAQADRQLELRQARIERGALVRIDAAGHIDRDGVAMGGGKAGEQRGMFIAQRPGQTAAEQAIDKHFAVEIGCVGFGLGAKHLALIE